MNRLLHSLGGYLCIHISGKGALDAVNTLNSENKKFWALTPGEDGFSLCCSLFDADSVKELLEAHGVTYQAESYRGLPALIRRFKTRWGLLVGLVVAMLTVYFSSTVVWDVRINCNGEFDEAAVRQALEELGVTVGVPIKDIDVYRTELQFLVNNSEFSDIAVNLEGTVASVELRLRRVAERHPPLVGYYDIVAKEAGVIKSITARHGVPAVAVGDTVEVGQVLIAGLMEGKFGESYYYHAEGNVTATVQREFYVAIPLETTRKEYTGNVEKRLCYEILGAEFKLYRKELSGFDKAEIHTKTSPVTIFGLKTPVKKQELYYKEYIITEEHISVAEAESRACTALEAYIQREGGKVLEVVPLCTYNKESGFVELVASITVETEIGIEKVG